MSEWKLSRFPEFYWQVIDSGDFHATFHEVVRCRLFESNDKGETRVAEERLYRLVPKEEADRV